jgi:hypothetical protein
VAVEGDVLHMDEVVVCLAKLSPMSPASLTPVVMSSGQCIYLYRPDRNGGEFLDTGKKL